MNMKLENIKIKNEGIKKVVIKTIIGLIVSIIIFPILAIIGFCNEPGKIIGFVFYFVLSSYAAYEIANTLPLPKWSKYYLPLAVFLFFFFTFPDTKDWITQDMTNDLSRFVRDQYIFKVGVEGMGYIITLVIVLIPFIFVRWHKKITPILILILYVSIILIGIVGKNLFYLNSGNFWIMMIMFGSVISTDTFAYFGGRLFHNKLFKHHKLAPKISPNKSIEGALIGYFIGFLVAFFCFFYLKDGMYSNIPILSSKHVRDILIPIIALTMPIVSIFGDLLFSWVKRFVNVKDFASIIPEHGGILDRLDAAIIVTFFYMLIFV